MIYANDFKGSCDSEVFENALKNLDNDRSLVIQPRVSDIEPERDFWLIDRAILIPENTTIILKNCKIKLSDKCRDNFFRSANCGFGFKDPEKIKNLHIIGEGSSILEGADRPRASGDASKIISDPCPYTVEDLIRLADWIPEERKKSKKLEFWDRHKHTYGTDAADCEQMQKGDWRNIGILLANVENFTISNIKIAYAHCWAISLEACAYGRVERIEFEAKMYRNIDGMLQNIENQDGLDLRNGCHDIIVSDITGQTGDDLVALTAIMGNTCHDGGELGYTHVMHSDWSRRDTDIYNIVIRNVKGFSNHCFDIRLLACGSKIRNIVIDGVVDTSPKGLIHGGCLLIGDNDGAYGACAKDSISNVTVSNVISPCVRPIVVLGYLKDASISNVICNDPKLPMITVRREDGLDNVKTFNLCTEGEEIVYQGVK